jgi:hypothetical protein
MIYLTAIGLTPGGSGTVHIYTQYTEYRDGTYITSKNIWKCRPCPVFDELYPGICLTAEKKARKNLS